MKKSIEISPKKTYFNKSKNFWFNFEELSDLNKFTGLIINNLEVRTQYMVLLKARYKVDRYAMLGHQLPFKYNNYSDLDSFHGLKELIISQLYITFDLYSINEDDINLIQLSFIEIEYGRLENFKLDSIKDKISNYEFSNFKRLFNLFPVSLDLVIYGIPLNIKVKNNIVIRKW